MNNCRLCATETAELTDLDIEGYGIVGVCEDCIKDAIREQLDRHEAADALYCRSCQHYTVDGRCTQGLTPLTCC